MKNYILGLTGQSGAGKTTVSALFAAKGAAIIDADKIARDICTPGSAVLKKIAKYFSSAVLYPNGSLNRPELAKQVFTDKKKLDTLNQITHPFIIEEIHRQTAILKQSYPIIILDAPQLFESGLNKSCDYIIAVLARQEIRLERILLRDNISSEAALQRFQSQYGSDFFIQHSDYIIENNGDTAVLKEQIEGILKKFPLD